MKSANARAVESTVAPAAVLTAAVGSDIRDLKQAILTRWGQSEKELGPLFSKLRSKLKASGKKGQGFGTWLDAHGIPRSTADRVSTLNTSAIQPAHKVESAGFG